MFQKRWFQIASSIVYGVVLFVLFLYWTFPYHQIQERVIRRFVPQADFQLSVGDLRPYWFTGVQLEDVVVQKVSPEGGEVSSLFQFDRLRARLKVVPLLWGAKTISFRSELYDGGIDGRLRVRADEVSLQSYWEGIDVARALEYLRRKWGIEVVGRVLGNIEYKGKKKNWQKGEGTFHLRIEEAKILPSSVLGGVFTIPETVFEDFNVQLVIAKGRVAFDEVVLKGSTLKGEIDGYVSLGRRLPQSRLNLKVALQPKEGLEEELKDYLSFLNLKKDPRTGEYQFSIVGTFGRPRIIK